MKLNKQSGITLIALVITIVVLLILAGASLNVVVGEHGILGKATQAKMETDEAKKEEEEAFLEVGKSMTALTLPAWTGEVKNSFEGVGSESNPYIIDSGETLKLLADEVNGGNTFAGRYFKMVNSINLASIEWEPIGNSELRQNSDGEYIYTKEFCGIFDGQNNIITNLNVNKVENCGVGLFGALGEGGEIRNVHIYSGTVIGRLEVGGIVGASRGTISGCRNNAKILAQDDNVVWPSGEDAGGIVGAIYSGKIENCINNGNVITKNTVGKVSRGKSTGGIVGTLRTDEEILIYGCENLGSIECEYQQAGGIVGSIQSIAQNSKIEKCINKGEVTIYCTDGLIAANAPCGICAGGIVGSMATGIVSECENTGQVTAGSQQAGGIVGGMNGGTVEECCNFGRISSLQGIGRGNSGGICGSQSSGSISMVFNLGEVMSEEFNGGVDVVGGITGYMNGGVLELAYSNGNLTGKVLGGIIGQKVEGTNNKTYYYSTDESLKGVGIKNTTELVKIEDVPGSVEKTTNNINSYNEFIIWIKTK